MKEKKEKVKINHKQRVKDALTLMLVFMKLGLFSFGGGATMLSLLHDELIVKRKWINNDELLEMSAISESTPGPIAINLATYLGMKKAGVLGSILATIGVVLPSFIIMFIISFIFQIILENQYIQYAFEGVKCGVIVVIVSAAIKLLKGMKKDWLTIVLFSITTTLMVLLTFFSINFYSLYFIFGGALIGFIYYGLIKGLRIRRKHK